MRTGAVEAVGRGQAIARAAETPMIMLNAPLVGNRLGYPELSGLDLLELFAFVHPARFAVPTPKGIAHALGLEAPESDEAAAPFLREAAAALLATLEADWPERAGAWASAQALWRLRWPWAGAIGAAAEGARARRALAVLEAARMGGERRPPAAAARAGSTSPTLRTGSSGWSARTPRRGRASATMPPRRPRSSRRASRRTSRICCSPRPGPGSARRSAISLPPRSGPRRPTARSGSRPTPRRCSASSTAKAHRLFPDPAERKAKIVIRKGRENYLCLLNLEDALQGGFAGRAAILAQLVARWAAYSQGRRHGRRRPAGLADLAVPPRRRDRA